MAYYTTTASGLGAGTHFEHRDWLGTERMRTSYNSAANPTYSVEGTFSSLPWGDGQVITGADTDAAHYAMLDHDAETDTDHAEFRQYANKQGRFFSPDPYDGSYDMSNPQSMNRYVYAMNNPLSYLDPSGLDACAYDLGGGNVLIYNDENGANIDCPGNGIYISTTGQVTGISLDANGDLSNYASDGALYNADGTLADVNSTVIVNGDNGSSVFVMTMNFSYSSVNYAPNNATQPTTLQKLEAAAKKFGCKGSAADRVWASVKQGAVIGAIRGGASGFVGGEIAEPLGGGIPGALLGGFLGGTMGGSGGVFTGSAIAIGCSLAGAY